MRLSMSIAVIVRWSRAHPIDDNRINTFQTAAKLNPHHHPNKSGSTCVRIYIYIYIYIDVFTIYTSMYICMCERAPHRTQNTHFRLNAQPAQQQHRAPSVSQPAWNRNLQNPFFLWWVRCFPLFICGIWVQINVSGFIRQSICVAKQWHWIFEQVLFDESAYSRAPPPFCFSHLSICWCVAKQRIITRVGRPLATDSWWMLE